MTSCVSDGARGDEIRLLIWRIIFSKRIVLRELEWRVQEEVERSILPSVNPSIRLSNHHHLARFSLLFTTATWQNDCVNKALHN
jgi:hypothetical protein